MLKFIGSGSAFNTKLGNNSAYYKEGNQMLLIDCGSNIFQRIKENNILEGIEHVHVLVTHTHADHVGSLADLILYTYYSHGEFAKPKVTVYSAKGTRVEELLQINGCTKNLHYIDKTEQPDCCEITINEFRKLTFIFFQSSHVSEIESFSIDLFIDEKYMLYTGDTNKLNKYDIDNINSDNNGVAYYIDTCKADYEGNVHLSLRKLTELIKPGYRNKVWCMHLDESFKREEAEELGFNVVNNEY